jgi:hypothetical protein
MIVLSSSLAGTKSMQLLTSSPGADLQTQMSMVKSDLKPFETWSRK